jgi:hypothetical protein
MRIILPIKLNINSDAIKLIFGIIIL